MVAACEVFPFVPKRSGTIRSQEVIWVSNSWISTVTICCFLTPLTQEQGQCKMTLTSGRVKDVVYKTRFLPWDLVPGTLADYYLPPIQSPSCECKPNTSCPFWPLRRQNPFFLIPSTISEQNCPVFVPFSTGSNVTFLLQPLALIGCI